ncbi:MAG: FAD-binding oxidoreductase, partial [Candidatus Thorarchaeota archaeon]
MVELSLSNKHPEVYSKLEQIVGKENISDDPSIRIVHSRDQSPFANLKPIPPEYVVLPENTEQIQKIMKISNEYKIPVVIQNTGVNASGACVPSETGSILLHLRRLNQIIEIDDLNMSATIQPYVSYADLQVETMKKGLWLPSPAAPSTVGVISNMLFCGMSWCMTKYGYERRSIICMTWVTPKGEIIKTGSSAIENGGNFWWNGPGPDLKGILTGAIGELGICTEMTVKLYPWVGGSQLKPDELAENTKILTISFSSRERMVKALLDLSRADIAIAITRMPIAWSIMGIPKSLETSKELWERRKQLEPIMKNFVFICIQGITSKKQLEYGEEVVRQIAKETRGLVIDPETVSLPIDQLAPDFQPEKNLAEFFRAKVSPRIMRFKGGFMPAFFPQEPIEKALKSEELMEDTLKDFPIHPQDLYSS